MESDKKIGDKVFVNFGSSGYVEGVVSGVKFNDVGQVLYDVKVFPFPHEKNNKHIFQEIKSIMSYFIEKPNDRFIGKSNMPISFIN